MFRLVSTALGFALVTACGATDESYRANLTVSQDAPPMQIQELRKQTQKTPNQNVQLKEETSKEIYACWREDDKNPASRVEIQLDKNHQNQSWTATYKAGATAILSQNLACRFIDSKGNHSSYCFDKNADHKSAKTFLSAVEKGDHIEVRLQSPELKKPEIMIFSLGVKTAGCTGLF